VKTTGKGRRTIWTGLSRLRMQKQITQVLLLLLLLLLSIPTKFYTVI